MQKFLYCIIIFFIAVNPATADQDDGIFSKEIRIEAQEALSFYGYDAGPADGFFGAQTMAALRAYQTSIGEQPTGILSRAGMGNLLQRYRQVRQIQAANTEKMRLPEPIVAAVAAMAKSCETTVDTMISRVGFLQKANLNNDGITDYLLDGSAADCSYLCGAANCQVSVVVSTSRGYRINEFLGGGISPNTFNCLSSGECEFAR